MSETKKLSDTPQKAPVIRQMSLFESASLNVLHRIKAALREAVKESGLSREQVADRMTEVMKTEGLRLPGSSKAVSRAIMDKWLSDSALHMIPLCLVPVLCHVTKSILPLQVMAQPLDFTVITNEKLNILRWAEAEISKRKLAKRARKLSEEIGL